MADYGHGARPVLTVEGFAPIVFEAVTGGNVGNEPALTLYGRVTGGPGGVLVLTPDDAWAVLRALDAWADRRVEAARNGGLQ